MRLLVLMALLAASSDGPFRPEPDCVSKCGVRMRDSSKDRAFCKQLQKGEDRMLEVFSKQGPKWDSDQMCRLLKGWYVTMRADTDYAPPNQEGVLHDPDGSDDRLLYGYTYTTRGTTELAKPASGKLGDSSFAHEMAHVFDLYLDDDEYVCLADDQPMHCRWYPRGVYDAIKTANRY